MELRNRKWRKRNKDSAWSPPGRTSGRRKEGRGGSRCAKRDPQTSSEYFDEFGIAFEDATRPASSRYASKAASSTGRNRSCRRSGKGRSSREESRPKAPGGRAPRLEERARFSVAIFPRYPEELPSCLMSSFKSQRPCPAAPLQAVANGLRSENPSRVRFACGSTRLQTDIFRDATDRFSTWWMTEHDSCRHSAWSHP